MFWVIFLVVGGGLVWIGVASAAATQKRLREAREAYDTSLAELKRNPTNPDLKQRTLALGRTYSNLTRQQKGVTVYDEVALSNDISAASAAATGQHPQTSQQGSLESRLARLTELRSQGVLAEDEFQTQRTRILHEL